MTAKRRRRESLGLVAPYRNRFEARTRERAGFTMGLDDAPDGLGSAARLSQARLQDSRGAARAVSVYAQVLRSPRRLQMDALRG